MNQHINALLGPLEAATRSDSWEDAEDIAREISRLARLERLKELQRIQEALVGRQGYVNLKQPSIDPKAHPRGSQGANPPLPVNLSIPIYQEKRQVSASELSENLKDPAWTAKAKAAGWDTEELRKAATKAIPVSGPSPIKQGESITLPTRKEWEAFGFSVPTDLCLETPDAPPEQWPFG